MVAHAPVDMAHRLYLPPSIFSEMPPIMLHGDGAYSHQIRRQAVKISTLSRRRSQLGCVQGYRLIMEAHRHLQPHMRPDKNGVITGRHCARGRLSDMWVLIVHRPGAVKHREWCIFLLASCSVRRTLRNKPRCRPRAALLDLPFSDHLRDSASAYGHDSEVLTSVVLFRCSRKADYWYVRDERSRSSIYVPLSFHCFGI